MISLYQKDQDIVFDFGSLGRFDPEGESLGDLVNIGGKNYAVGTVLEQDGVKYEVQLDGSLTQL